MDFTSYKPPGVYVEEFIQPTIATAGISPTIIGIVGPSIGYRTFTEAVVVSGTSASPLSKLGVNVSSATVRAGDGTLYDPSTYAFTVAAGADGNIATTVDNTTTVARVGATIPDGTTIYVTYRYTDGDYFTPFSARDFDVIQNAFGLPTDPVTGLISSPLSLAAQFALVNGATDLVLVPTPNLPATRADLASAYSKFDAHPEVNIIVPLPVGITGTTATPGDTSTLGLDLKVYCEASTNLGVPRVGILGESHQVTVDPLAVIAGFQTKRVMYAYPNSLSFYSGSANTTYEVGGYYLAAACAGRFASLGPQEPLTKKEIRGFAGLSPTTRAASTLAQKNVWSNGGVAVVELNRAGSLVMRHGTTTDRTSTMTREMSLVRAKDTLTNLINDTLSGSGLIGGFIENSTLPRVQGAMISILETALRYRIVVGYTDVKVRQRPGDPQVIEVKFSYQPAYPLNYINVIFSVDATTGQTSLTQAA